jgi:hypothetical protein
MSAQNVARLNDGVGNFLDAKLTVTNILNGLMHLKVRRKSDYSGRTAKPSSNAFVRIRSSRLSMVRPDIADRNKRALAR